MSHETKTEKKFNILKNLKAIILPENGEKRLTFISNTSFVVWTFTDLF